MARSRLIDLASVQQFQAINLLSDPGHIGGPVVIPSAVRVSILYTAANSKSVRNVLCMTVPSAFQPTVTIANSMFTALTTGASFGPFAGFIAPSWSIAGVELLDIRSPTGIPVRSTSTAVPGTSTGIALPGEVAAVVTLHTNSRGRSGRGRMFVPGWASNALGAGDVIAAAAVTALANWAGTNVTGMFTAAGGTWVLALPARAAYVSPVTGTSHPARDAGSLPITGLVVRDNHWDSQRRRGLK